MTESLRFLRALQRIADTARRINPNPRPAPTIQATPNILTSLPEHKSLLPLLLSHDIPSKLARACADKYDGYANQLRSETESKLAPYLANRKKSQPAKAYSLFLDNYSKALRRWSQHILNAALKSLKRDSVELRNWEVTYPAPLWLPLPPNLVCARGSLEKPCSLSSIPSPSHAFPTAYPPPLRPTIGVSPVEWPRMPAASPTPPTTSAIDLDSLCDRFAASLIIDENPPRCPRQPKPSIFSQPAVAKEEPSKSHSRPKISKRKCSRPGAPRKLPVTGSSVQPLKAVEPRQLSMPPSFSSPFTRPKPTPRKTSAPTRVSMSRNTPVSQPPGAAHHNISTSFVSPLNTTATDGSDIRLYSCLDTPPLSSEPSPISTLGQNIHTGLSCSPTGPTTPPVLLPDLFSEFIVVPSTPIPQSPASSLMPIADPFLQFQPQYDYFSDPSLVPLFDYSGLTPALATGGSFSKSAFDMPFGSDHLWRNISTPTTYDPFENNFFNTYIVS